MEESAQACRQRPRGAISAEGGVLQELAGEGDTTISPEKEDLEDEDEPQLGVVLKLAEVSGCELDACTAALVSCQGDFHAALAKLRETCASGSAKARAQMRAALQMLEEARIERSVAWGAIGGAWIAAALLLHAFELIVPRRFLEIFLCLLGLREDGPLGLLALLLPPISVVLLLTLVLRDLDGYLNAEVAFVMPS
mmetsp:Transcript_67940/g.107752  ORF Transcript_67940/g.107752 Transcript_67940/m.107752 type:complete len:196 (-) Transcript_67940:2-589(-)